MARRGNVVIAESLGWDAREVSDHRYQNYVNPPVYAIGDRYFAASVSKPSHKVGKEWVAHTDQFGARNTAMTIWVADMESSS